MIPFACQATSQGARLTITGRDGSRLSAAAERLGGVETAELDAHDDGALERFFAGLGPVDHVVSMVGDSMAGGVHDHRSRDHAPGPGVEVLGQLVLREGGSPTFTSGTGGRPHEISTTYIANVGLGALVQGLAVELAPRTSVNAVTPTFMGSATAFWKDVPAEKLRRQEARTTCRSASASALNPNPGIGDRSPPEPRRRCGGGAAP